MDRALTLIDDVMTIMTVPMAQTRRTAVSKHTNAPSLSADLLCCL